MPTNELSKLLDQKLAPITSELETLNGRLEALEDASETAKPTRLRVIEIQNQLEKIEKRMTQLSGKIEKTATRDDLVTVKKKLGSIDKKFDKLFDHIDNFAAKTAQRVRHIERHVDIPPFKPAPLD